MVPIIFFLDNRPKFKQNVINKLLYGEDSYNDIKIGDVRTEIFSDGEISIDYETSIRGKVVYIVSTPNSSEKIMTLNLAIDAAKRAGAKEIIPIITYFPYGRSDKKDQTRGSIGGKVIAEMIENRGATSVILFDLHADQTQGFFNIPVIHMEGKYIFDDIIFDIYKKTGGNLVLCSPDAGASKRVKGFRDRVKTKYNLNFQMVMIDKTRKEANKVNEMVLIGDVIDKDVIIIDDMADTCGTLVKATTHLLEMGAKSVRGIITHGVLSGPAIDRLYRSELTELYCTDTLPIELNLDETMNLKSLIKVVSIDSQMIKAIKGISKHISIESLKNKK